MSEVKKIHSIHVLRSPRETVQQLTEQNVLLSGSLTLQVIYFAYGAVMKANKNQPVRKCTENKQSYH